MADAQGSEIAVLILAHTKPDGLAALSRFFDGRGFDVFAHVDAKVDEAPFRASPGVEFIEPRIGIFWRGFTMVEAMIALLKAAQRRKPYSSYVFLSDDTLPLHAPRIIRERLLATGDYVCARKAEDFRHRYDSFFLFDSPATQVRWIPLQERVVTPAMLGRMHRLDALMARGKKPLKNFWYGSQWMALSAGTAEKILWCYESDPWLRDSFEFSEVPDESYFQTIIGESSGPIDKSLVYVDWSAPSPPRIFTDIAEIAALNRPEFLFMRKASLPQIQLRQWVDRLLAPSDPA